MIHTKEPIHIHLVDPGDNSPASCDLHLTKPYKNNAAFSGQRKHTIGEVQPVDATTSKVDDYVRVPNPCQQLLPADLIPR